MSSKKNYDLDLNYIFSKKRLEKIETPQSKNLSHTDLMKNRLKELVEKVKSGQSSVNNLLMMDSSGPHSDDFIH